MRHARDTALRRAIPRAQDCVLSEEELVRCLGDQLYQMEWWHGRGALGGRSVYTDRGHPKPTEGLAAYYYDKEEEDVGGNGYILPCTKEKPRPYSDWGSYDEPSWQTYGGHGAWRYDVDWVETPPGATTPCGVESEWEERDDKRGYLRSMGALACNQGVRGSGRRGSTLSCE